MLRSGFPGLPSLTLGAALLCLASVMAHAQTAPGQPEEFSSTAACPSAAVMKIYEQQRAADAKLTGRQRAQHDANLERWYKHKLSECRLQSLNQQLAQYAKPLRQAAQFSHQMRLAAEALLQAAGRISKAMTDAMDVTKHNNVGISVALGGYLGSLGKLGEGMNLAAKEYRAAAATVKAAQQQKALLTLSGVAKTQSAITAEKAAQIAREVGTEVGLPPAAARPATPAPQTLPPTALPEPDGYLTGIKFLNTANPPAVAQGNLPTCGVLACHRLAGLLGRNISIFQAFNRIRPRVVLAGPEPGASAQEVGQLMLKGGGLTAEEIANGLHSIGVPAEVGTGLTNMMNEVRAGRPVIAGVRTAAAQSADLHAVVVEGMETQSGVLGLTVYDPGGLVYWQPLSIWQRFFDGVFVRPL